MKNLSEIRKERKDVLAYWTVGDITENWAPVMRDLWTMLEELDKLGY